MQTIYPEEEVTLKEYQNHHLLNTVLVAWYVTDIIVLPRSNHTFLYFWFIKELQSY